jgi:ketosteroid isomerase-like protein
MTTTDPDELERLFVARADAGDLDGLLALFEPDAVLVDGDGVARGGDGLRAALAAMLAAQDHFTLGEQRPALVAGDLALTSTLLADGALTAEVARRHPDGTWRWLIDVPDVRTPWRGDGGGPDGLARRFVEHANARDAEGLVSLYEREAVMAFPPGNPSRGAGQLRDTFDAMVAADPQFVLGEQRPALIAGDLALTSTRLPGGAITAEVARRQADGSWLWVVDNPDMR